VVQLFDAAGRSIGLPIALPVDANWFPTGQTVNSGIILEVAYGPGPGGDEIWNPNLNHVEGALTGRTIAAHGTVIVSGASTSCRECTIRITDVLTGENRSVRLPTGAMASGSGSISPDGSTLALALSIRAHRARPIDEVVVVDLASGTARALPGAGLGTNPSDSDPTITWSRSGWLFAAGVGRTRIVAWRPGTRAAVTLPSAKLPFVHLEPPPFQTEYPSMIAR
jgi:hypothetical protein